MSLSSKALAIAQNMVKLGFPLETVGSATQLDPEKVKALVKEAVFEWFGFGVSGFLINFANLHVFLMFR